MRYRRQGLNPIWVLMGVNFVILVATIVNHELIYLRFGLIPALISEQPWMILTYMFVHAGVWHLLANMFTLYFFGNYVISIVGETNFMTTYFVGGIMGGLAFLGLSYVPLPYFELTRMSLVVGASGAVFAIGGLLTIMQPKARVMLFPLPVPIPLWVAVIFGFFILSFLPGIAWQAHLGGLLFGLLMGVYFRRRMIRRYW